MGRADVSGLAGKGVIELTHYWLLFGLVALRAMSQVNVAHEPVDRVASPWRLTFVALVLMIGLRHEVGGDWMTYMDHLMVAKYETLAEALEAGDPAYSILNWVAATLDLGVYFANLICAGLFAWGLIAFCRAQSMPWLAILVAVPYLVIVVAMGYTRQATAIGLAMLGLVALADHKTMKFVLFVVFAALFHKTAVILIPLAVLANAKNRIWSGFLVGISALVFYQLLLQDSVEVLKAGYLVDQYASSGAAIRVAMNAVPAALFLILRNRFDLPPYMRVFWTWMALGAMGFIVLLYVSPSSTAVDRFALYWIPIQLFVFSRLPHAMATTGHSRDTWFKLVVIYCTAVLFVWLFFADHAYLWIPYQFYPWVALWE